MSKKYIKRFCYILGLFVFLINISSVVYGVSDMETVIADKIISKNSVIEIGKKINDVLSKIRPELKGEVSASEPESSEPELKVSYTPKTFFKLHDKVNVQISLTNQSGETSTDKAVITDLDTGEKTLVTIDDLDKANIEFTHDNKDRKIYSYKLQARGLSKEISIPVLEFKAELEKNPATNRPYKGVLADGTSSVEIKIDLKGYKEGTLSLKKTQLGKIEGDAYKNGVIKLNGTSANITYIPDEYIDNEKYIFEGLAKAKAKETLIFSYTSDKNTTEYEIDVDIYKPPVVLVHGFTGDNTTWSMLDSYLSDLKYDTVKKDYYYKDQSVYDRTRLLHTHIQDKLTGLEKNGIKGTKVDIVAHSIGGLIARYYVNNAPYYAGNVRKLIMVATPNHGCNWNDLQIGSFRSWWTEKHESAAERLYKDSEFIKQLNEGEDTGKHLNADVEYGIIYAYSHRFWFFGGDGVVSIASAFLNGVTTYYVNEKTHSNVLSVGTPITQDDRVFSKIKIWLQNEIYKPQLKNTLVEVIRAEGDVSVRYTTQTGVKKENIKPENIKTNPVTLKPWYDLYTNEGKAMVYITVNGLPWGYIHLDSNTEISIGFVSPKMIEIKMKKGRARYTTYKVGGGHFTVDLKPTAGRYANVTALNTDFVISAEDLIKVKSLAGKLIVKSMDNSGRDYNTPVNTNTKVIIEKTGQTSRYNKAMEKWWEDEFYELTFKDRATSILTAVSVQTSGIVKKGNLSKYLIVGLLIIILAFLIKRHSKLIVTYIIISLITAGIFLIDAKVSAIPYVSDLREQITSNTNVLIYLSLGVFLLSLLFYRNPKKRRIANYDD